MRIKTQYIVIVGFFSFLIATLLFCSVYSKVDTGEHKLVRTGKLLSKGLVVRILYHMVKIGSNITGKDLEPPTPLHDAHFRYEDLSHPYFDKIRSNERLRHFYQGAILDYQEAISMADFLRNQFAHGRSRNNHHNNNLLEMLDAADQGEYFLCGNISKMLVQMIQAGGNHARIIRLHGHAVIEFWSQRLKKWVLIDPDYNVYYRDLKGVPLSAFELHQYVNGDRTQEIVPYPGKSPNSLFRLKLNSHKQLLEKYRRGFIIDFYAKWVSLNLPRIHPYRSPVISAVVYGENRFPYYYRTKVKDIKSLYNDPRKHVIGLLMKRTDGKVKSIVENRVMLMP